MLLRMRPRESFNLLAHFRDESGRSLELAGSPTWSLIGPQNLVELHPVPGSPECELVSSEFEGRGAVTVVADLPSGRVVSQRLEFEVSDRPTHGFNVFVAPADCTMMVPDPVAATAGSPTLGAGGAPSPSASSSADGSTSSTPASSPASTPLIPTGAGDAPAG